MSKAALAFVTLAVLVIVQLAWSDDPKKPDEKPAPSEKSDVLLDKPQEVTLLLSNGKKRPVYLVNLTSDELSYKGSANGTVVIKFAAKEGFIAEIQASGGDKFLFNKATGKFEPSKPSPPASVEKPPTKDKPNDKKEPAALQMTPVEQAILDLANKEREKEKLPPLKPSAKLIQLSRDHSLNMAKQNKLDHVLDGKSPFDRAREAGYPAPVAENCAWGARTAADVITGWMNSPGHRANLLNKNATEAGVGVAPGDRIGPYTTMVLGLRRLR